MVLVLRIIILRYNGFVHGVTMYQLIIMRIIIFFGWGGELNVNYDALWFAFFCNSVALGLFLFWPSGHWKLNVLLPAVLQV